MKPNKRLAAVVAGALAASGAVAIATAAPAQAAFGTTTGTISYNCVIVNNGVGSTVASYPNVAATVTVSPSSVNVGASQTISLNIGAGANSSYTNGPTPVSAGAYQAIANVSIDGAAPQNMISATVSADDSLTGNSPVFPGGWTASASVTAGTGNHTIEIDQIIYNSVTSGPVYSAWPAATSVATESRGFDSICNSGTTHAQITGGANASQLPIPGWYPSATPALYLNAVSTGYTVVGPNATITTSTGQPAGAQAIGRTSFTASKTVVLDGSVFPASQAAGAFTVEFCTTAGAGCDVTTPVTNTLASDGGGLLTGAITIPATSPVPGLETALTSGSRAIKITGGTLTTPVLVPFLALGTPTLNVSPSAGGPGTVVAVSGTNFNVSTTTGSNLIYGTTSTTASGATDNTSDGTVAFSTDANGAFGPLNYTVNDVLTKGIVAAQGLPIMGAPSIAQAAGYAAFTVNEFTCDVPLNTGPPSNCNTRQNVYATVLAGNLSQTAAPTAGNPDATTIVFCDTAGTRTAAENVANGNNTDCGLESPLVDTPMFGTLNTVTVSDTRGGSFGWSLTAQMPNLSAGVGKSIANGNASITPTCASTNSGSAQGVTAAGGAITTVDGNGVGSSSVGTPQALSGTVTLCTKSTAVGAASDTSGGQWAISGPLVLTVPAFQAAGQYNSTLTVNLA